MNEIDLDKIDLTEPPPEHEPERQYYFMAKCREYVRAESKRLGRPLFCATITFGWADVSERELCEKEEIITDFGEKLSWTYLCFVRDNPITWNIPTEILYAGNDTLISRQTVDMFVSSHHVALTVMENGEHWFHTDKQLAFLDGWMKRVIC